jgi:hypothetical protein
MEMRRIQMAGMRACQPWIMEEEKTKHSEENLACMRKKRLGDVCIPPVSICIYCPKKSERSMCI